jgi:hypothetical protein
MQKKKWVRVGLAGVLVGGTVGGISAVGCGSSSSGGSPTADAGPDSSVLPSDGGIHETGTSPDTGADTGAPPVFAKVYLVHAAVDPKAPPFRFCFALGNATDGGTVTVTDAIPPFPDTKLAAAFPVAGLFPGFGGSVASSPKLSSFDLSKIAVSLYALDATKIANDTADGGPGDGGAELPCENYIGGNGLGAAGATDAGAATLLTEGTDYWFVGSIGVGTLNHGETWIAAVTGCAPGEGVDEQAFCPTVPAYSATTGNFALTTFKLDNTTAVGDGGLGAQFANASKAWDTEGTLSGGAATAAGFWMLSAPTADAGSTDGGEAGSPGDASTDAAVDGAVDAAVESGTEAGSSPPEPVLTFLAPPVGTGVFAAAPGALVTVPVPLNSAAAGFYAALVTADGGVVASGPAGAPCTVGVDCISPLLYPLPAIDQVTYGSSAPAGGSFVNGKGYVFLLVGDPLSPPYINPLDGGASTAAAGGVFNGNSAHFLGFPTSNP